MQVPFDGRIRKRVIAGSIAAFFGGASVPVLADMESLIEKLHDKGVLNDEEYEEMSAEARAERIEREASVAEAQESVGTRGSYAEGFAWDSADGEQSIQIAGRIQFDYRHFDNNATPSGFDIRRAYLGVKGRLNRWTYELTQDFANDRLEYAFLDYKVNNSFRMRGGAFKFAFGFEQLTSSRFTDFQERSLVDAWVPGKDVGVMIYGAPNKKVWSYGLGVANGEGKNTDENDAAVDDKDVIGRVAVNFAPLMKWENGILHTGFNYSNGVIPDESPGSNRTEGRGQTFFTAAAPVGVNEMDRTRTAFEGVVAYGPVKLQTEWLTANYKADGGYDKDIDVSYVAANWLITGEEYVSNYTTGGMRRIRPDNPVESGGKGAWEIGIRYSQLDAGDYANTPTSTNKADAVTVGLKWIPDPLVRIMFNYVDTSYSTPILADGIPVNGEKAATLRAQLDF
jgi:phosphate-selective porin OprO/OprP